MTESASIRLPPYYYSSLKLLDMGRLAYSFGVYLSKDEFPSLKEVLYVLSSPKRKEQEPWKKFEIITENKKAEIIYTDDPPEILKVNKDSLILAYRHETVKASSLPSYKRLVDAWLNNFPDITEDRLKVETYTEIIFMETNEGVLAVAPATSRKAFKNKIIPLLNLSELKLSKQVSITNPYDFLIWLYERTYNNAKVASAEGLEYTLEKAKDTLLKTSSVAHKSKSYGNLDISKDDPVPPLSIFGNETMERLGVVLTKKTANERYGFDIVILSTNEVGFVISKQDLIVEQQNKYMKRVLFFLELYKRIIPTLMEEYKSDKNWPKRRNQFKSRVAVEIIKRTIPELAKYLCQQTNEGIAKNI